MPSVAPVRTLPSRGGVRRRRDRAPPRRRGGI